jgi:hypothetical protein
MLRYLNKIHKASFLLIAFVVLIVSCKKAAVDFGKEALTDDPNTFVLDTMTVNMSTFQLDSFVTSGDNLFKVGVHTDPIFGKYESKAFMQIGLPSGNNISNCTNCRFDSIVFVTKFTGAIYGDSTEAFTLNVHRMTQQVNVDVTPIGYNVDTFGYDPSNLGSLVLSNTRPSQFKQFTVRMNDAFGLQLFDLFKRNSDTITDANVFTKFFNGIALTGKGTNNNSVYYFENAVEANEVVMQLYYTTTGSAPVQASIDFPISPTSFQFNGYTYDKTGTNLTAFIPKKKMIMPTSQTGNISYLHSNSGLFPYFNFPSLFAVKELHPYIKVIKAVLEIDPTLQNYGPNNLNFLPPTLSLYSISDDKVVGGVLRVAGGGTTAAAQTGNLVIDNEFHINTKYTFDLTDYINNILKNGNTVQQDLVLIPGATTVENRLILNDAINNKSVKLTLYVLGL